MNFTNTLYAKPWQAIPREPASDPKYVKHVQCEGARYHVLSYDSNGVHCSEHDCIINKPHTEPPTQGDSQDSGLARGRRALSAGAVVKLGI